MDHGNVRDLVCLISFLITLAIYKLDQIRYYSLRIMHCRAYHPVKR